LVFDKYWLLPNIGVCQILPLDEYWLLPNIDFCQLLALGETEIGIEFFFNV
jgi:hypothetical protein